MLQNYDHHFIPEHARSLKKDQKTYAYNTVQSGIVLSSQEPRKRRTLRSSRIRQGQSQHLRSPTKLAATNRPVFYSEKRS